MPIRKEKSWKQFRASGPRVLIVNKFVTQYRRPFFEKLRESLGGSGIRFDLVYGDPMGDDASKSDSVELDWAIRLPNKHFSLGRRKIIYQPVARLSASYDLVIVEQANKLLVNAILLGMNRMKVTRVAFWGHGKDFQGGDGYLGSRIKRVLVPHVHWWFAYNELSASVVRETGYPNERITRVMNTIDNEVLKATLDDISPEELEHQRKKLGLRGRNICIYIGGMYDKKRLSFLLEACKRIRTAIPDFEILFLGSGVDRPLIDDFSSTYDWAIACGPVFDREKAMCLKLSKLLLMPGLVGLAIIDSFTAEVPIVTTKVPYHSPEIDYLINGVNGEMIASADSVREYSDEVIKLLSNKRRLSALQAGCKDAAHLYTMGSMVDRFADGVQRALRS